MKLGWVAIFTVMCCSGFAQTTIDGHKKFGYVGILTTGYNYQLHNQRNEPDFYETYRYLDAVKISTINALNVKDTLLIGIRADAEKIHKAYLFPISLYLGLTCLNKPKDDILADISVGYGYGVSKIKNELNQRYPAQLKFHMELGLMYKRKITEKNNLVFRFNWNLKSFHTKELSGHSGIPEDSGFGISSIGVNAGISF